MDMSSCISTASVGHSNDPHEDHVADHQSVADDHIISQDFHHLRLQLDDPNADDIDTHTENEHHDDDDDDDDFSFVFIGGDEPINFVGKAFKEGQIFPLFDQKLLLDGAEYELEQVDQTSLPFQPPVDKVFTELPHPRGGGGLESSKNLEDGHHEEEEEEAAAAGPFCAWSKDQSTSSGSSHHHHHQLLISKKSNSTGFSKLWRLREKVHRSNSDGRDAFVFLKASDKTTSSSSSSSASSSSSSSTKTVSGDGSHGTTFVKVVNGNGTPKAKVVKKTTISAHEAYMRSRGGHAEEERRKSYLPYRPELMGFFTNVHGGLTKNVHPY